MLRLRHLSGALIVALAVSAAAQAGTTDIHKVVVFGDSLSDAGNLSIAGGLPQVSRFTTNPGDVAVQYIAAHYGVTLAPSLGGGTDFAFGDAGILNNSPGAAAGVPTITSQVQGYIQAAGTLDGHTLFSMWGGANDIFYHATMTALGNETSAQAQAGIDAAAAQEVTLLGAMHDAGARYILVFNLPDIGLTPDARRQGAAAAAGLSGLSQLYNGVLDASLNGLSDAGVNIVPVNIYAMFNEVLADPAAYGFTNVTTPACGVGSTSLECGPAGSGAPYTYAPGTDESYLFADGVHPTTAGHRMVAQYVIAELTAPGQTSMLAEVPLATGNAHLALLRDQMRIDQAGGTTRAFAGVNYARQRIDATGNSPKTDSSDVNLAIGVDASAGDHVNAGVALGLARSNADIGGGGGFRLDSIIGSGYLTWHSGGAWIGANAAFGQLSYNDINRRFPIGALTRIETGETSGSQLMAGLDAGWLATYGNWQMGPFVRMEWQRVRVKGYNEKGDDSSAMWFGQQTRNAMVGTLGWQVQGNWKAGASTWHPYLNVAWHNDSRADARKVRAGLNGMQGSFAMTGFIPDDNWMSADLGLAADFTPAVSGWIGYHGRFGDSNERVDGLNVGMKITF